MNTFKTLLLTLVLIAPGATPLPARPQAPASPAQTPIQTPPAKASTMTHASGSFDVKSSPTDHAPDPTLGSYSLDKTYHGDLEGSGKGEMLSAGDPASGNAGYVAIERVTGTLAGKAGSFAVMQSGTMSAGSPPQISAQVVPGSGTGDLSGIYGNLTIIITGGKHAYTLDYAFAR